MKHVLFDQLVHTLLHGTPQNEKAVWTMQYDLEELKSMYKMSTGGLMVTPQIYFYDQDQSHAKVDINQCLSTQLNEKQDIQDTYVQNEI